MKNYLLLFFVIFSFSCTFKQAQKPENVTETTLENNKNSNFVPDVFLNTSQKMYPGYPLATFKKNIGTHAYELGRESMQAGSMCIVFKDNTNKTMTLEVKGSLIQRWIIDRGQCGTFWLLDNYKKFNAYY